MLQKALLENFAIILLLDSVFSGTLLALGGWVGLRILSRAHPRISYFFLLFCFVCAFAIPIVDTLNCETRVDRAETERKVDSSVIDEPAAAAGVIAIEPDMKNDWWVIGERLLSITWVSIALVLLACHLSGYLWLTLRRRNWRPAFPIELEYLDIEPAQRVLISRSFGPATIGILEPAVVIPESLLIGVSRSAARRVLRHELAHRQWFDLHVRLFVRLLLCLMWPNPALWFFGQALKLRSEAAADREALATCNRIEGLRCSRVEFAESMVEAIRFLRRYGSRRRFGVAFVPFFVRNRMFRRRVELLLDSENGVSRRPVLASVIALGVFLILFFFLPTFYLRNSSLATSYSGSTTVDGPNADAGNVPDKNDTGALPVEYLPHKQFSRKPANMKTAATTRSADVNARESPRKPVESDRSYSADNRIAVDSPQLANQLTYKIETQTAFQQKLVRRVTETRSMTIEHASTIKKR